MKKALTHVEVVISFVMFIFFLILIFSLMKPLKKTEDKSYLIENVKKMVEKKTVVDVTRITMGIENETFSSLRMMPESVCIKINLTEFGINTTNKKVRVKADNSPVNASISDGLATINFVGAKLYEIYLSENLNEIQPSCQIILDTSQFKYLSNFTIGLITETSMLSKEKLEALKQEYETNYSKLKDKFFIRGEFDILVVNSTKHEIARMERNVPSTVNIFAREFPIEIIDSEARIQSGIMKIRVW